MSKYEWERGTIVIPADQWVGFRRRIIEAHNQEQERLFKLAVDVLERVRALGKGKRGFDYKRAVRETAESLTSEMRDWCDDGHVVVKLLGMAETWDAATRTMLPGADKPRAPKRKDLNLRPLTRDTEKPLHADEGTIVLIEAEHAVRWSVSENNHACDTARNHPIGRALFAELARVQWKRGSGGKIVGNDEYNGDSSDEGGGSNYVTAEFGPNVSRPSRFSSLGFGGYR